MRNASLDALEFELDEETQECPELDDDPLVPASSDVGSASGLRYNLTWKLHLRKGRLTMLTEDTIEDVDMAPGAYWSQVLESELATIVTSKVPAPDYQPDETRIVVSTSKRGEPDFPKRFNALNINWTIVENKLRTWSSQGNTLTVAVSFIYKESQQATASKANKIGRGATKRQLAARDKLVAQQEATGVRPV